MDRLAGRIAPALLYLEISDYIVESESPWMNSTEKMSWEECTELVFSTHNIFKLPTKPVLLVKIFVIELST